MTYGAPYRKFWADKALGHPRFPDSQRSSGPMSTLSKKCHMRCKRIDCADTPGPFVLPLQLLWLRLQSAPRGGRALGLDHNTLQ